VVSMVIMAFLTLEHQRGIYERELETKARVLLAAISVPCISALASNEIHDLDRIIEEFRRRMSADGDVAGVAVLDKDLRVVGHTDQLMYGRILKDEFSISASSRPASILRITGSGKSRVMRISLPLNTFLEGLHGIRWGTLIAEVDMARAERELRDALWHSWRIYAGLVVIIGLLIFFGLERGFLRPIARLSEVSAAIREGNLEVRSGLPGKGALASLSHTFDEMAEKLQQHATSLQSLVDERTHELNKTNKELLQTMEQLTAANRKLDELARTDALTGLFNHRHMKDALSFHFALAKRGNRSLAFAMLDVDHFKRNNDRHGHPAGDLVLKMVADIVRDRVRQTDIPCRYGGEEFAVMLPDTGLDQAYLVAEDLRRKMAETAFPLEESQPGGRLSVAIGVASLMADMQDPVELIRRADEALYHAKETGRNRTVVAMADGSLSPTPKPPEEDAN